MRNSNLSKLILASLFAALSCICFAYLRIEVPMGGGMTGKIYIGHTFIILSAVILGTKYGALTGAVGLTIGDLLAGYTTSAPPTFIAKFILGYAVAFTAHKIFSIATETDFLKKSRIFLYVAIVGEVVNVLTEPIIRYAFKVYILGVPSQIAYLSSINCAVSEVISAIPIILLGSILYRTVVAKGLINIPN